MADYKLIPSIEGSVRYFVLFFTVAITIKEWRRFNSEIVCSEEGRWHSGDH